MSADSSYLRNDDDYDRYGEAGGTKDRLLGRVRSLVDSAADASYGVREQVGRGLERTREHLGTARRAIGDKSRAGTEAARGYVRAKPLSSLGVATLAGVLVGLLVVTVLNSRRD